MQVSSLTIGVNGINQKALRDFLDSYLSENHLAVLRSLYNFSVDVIDYKEEFLYAKTFLQQNDLEDENLFFRNFVIDDYSLVVSFDFPQDFAFMEVFEPVVFMIGKGISSKLKASCLVMFDSMKVPVGLFEEGSLTQTFTEYNKTFFQNKPWCPSCDS